MPCGGRTSDSTTLQLPGTNDPNDITYSGMPQFRISGYSTYGNPGSARPQTWHDNQRRYNANLTWMKGTHGFRFGFDLSHEHMNHWQIEAGGGPRGDFAYSGGDDGHPERSGDQSAQCVRGVPPGVALVHRQSGRSRTAADDARVAAGVLCARPVAGDA